MNDRLVLIAAQPGKPVLPVPTRERWQPLRLGLVELFHYDSEEFWFRDGHLLLRGNNGTGKSKVLSLTLPLLLDAQLKPSRIEPDGDGGKKMAWNLLMNSYDRRIGYAWIEFGRIAEDGAPRYLSLGVGLSATAARPQVDSWFFLIEDADDAPRISQDLWLTSAQRVVLTRERLRDALEGRGQLFDTAASYRRAVDERLFHLGTRRYDALMDTLIQLRQPQLSRKPDETALSNALTEALPPLAPELLGDVAEALGQLEEDRRQLEEYQALARAVGRFEERYRAYAGTQTRRQARLLRQAQTEFDNASRARGEAQARFDEARAQEALARTAHQDAEIDLARGRARLDTLRSDPTMQDANRLEGAQKEAAARQQAMRKAAEALEEATRRLGLSTEETERAARRMEQAESVLTDLRRQSAAHADATGIAAQHGASPLAVSQAPELVELTRQAFDKACAGLRSLVDSRREQIAVLRRRQAEVAQAEAIYARRREIQDERRLEAEEAAGRRTQADAEVEREGRSLVESWDGHFIGLKQLHVDPDDRFSALAALAEWAVALQGDDPARHLLQSAHQHASHALTQRRVEIDNQCQALASENERLSEEGERLEAGADIAPPLPYTRSTSVRENRQGAPLWQVVDFRDKTTATQRAGLEAALEAAGLLDAWISPDGRLQAGDDGRPLLDVQVLERQNRSQSLADWLHVTVPAGCDMPDDVVGRVLSGIACADDDPVDSEAWIAPDGRFRLGSLCGAWGKPVAVFIGHVARATARMRRLAEISERLAELSAELAAAQAMAAQLALDREQADEELRRAPADEALRSVHLAAAASTRQARLAGERLADADMKCLVAEKALEAVREQLAADAADLHLPESPDALRILETALQHYRDAQVRLEQAVHELRLAMPEWQRQRIREDEARGDMRQREEDLAAARIEAEDAFARFDVLRDAVGAKVEELQRQLSDARIAVESGETASKLANEVLRDKGEARAVASQQVETANVNLLQRGEARAQAILKLQQFADTGLLSAALPDIDLPDMDGLWTIDPALTLARRAEQGLSGLKDDDEAWARVQRQISEELTELQRALGALGHQVQADQNDWGFSVNIIYQNRRERPDRLAMRLAEEIAQRSELLTANERAVLENHLQAEIASEIQRLLQAAERQVDAINRELHKRPTSTGVRYRLVWQPLAEEEGAPIGLDLARKRLLNTSSDLWSVDDRSVVGAMLQQRISAERERADSIDARDAGGTLLDQLARALDYRHWHRFRVERWQEGGWGKLSGPASSGERALGLTVPLFAAVASFYSQGSYALAPRLMLLDEAFAGIDDTARAHCMGLIREFDLDFVITSEREWACYAELPGVAICQLQRREGIDAVFVSRWTWDGRDKTLQADPDRRFAPA
ncbi:TIGR02680 family protein [Mesorhizobium sp. VK25A]|uniref:TIGR02680 family protein n=1 Tax=Mesorhizobium vachelliae TaxID=3072309 RepID=A0ABU5AEU4_9HYPH|nr:MULTISPECIES: TIGR02680 family protein [unclassified Mesorhizobium]MDX8535792.1 TIGR02680 family protein [Mesorhizobium sp. VK25D]MDX8548543.1 TIGR02680 family protein [Mesorhizobium sp. VK25A]